MRKKILSIYLAVAIGFLSVVASAVPAYASSSPEWSDYFEITYSSSDINSPYSLEFKDSKAQTAYKNLSKDERKKIDFDAFSAISAKDQNHKYGSLVFNNTTIPDLIKGIAASSGMFMSGAPDDTGFTADLQDKLTKISNSISASNRKFGGKGISRKASSTHPNNFGLGTLTLSKDFINDLRSNVAKFDDYMVYPALSESINWYTTSLGLPPTVTNSTFYKNFTDGALKNFRPVFSYNMKFNSSDTALSHFYFFPICGSKYFYFLEDNLLRAAYINANGGLTIEFLPGRSDYLTNYGGSERAGYWGSLSSSISNIDNFMGRVGRYTFVFYSRQALNNYINRLNGNAVSNYYISTEIVNNDYSTTVNKIYDYSSHDTYTTVNNKITKTITEKGSGLTEEEYQKIVNDVTKQLREEIDSKDDGGNTGGGSGGDSGNTGGGESNTWLEKIYNRLGDILQKIGTVTGVDTLLSLVQQIADDVHKLKNGEAIAPDLSVTNGLLSDISASLKTLIAVQSAGDIADLLTDTVGDKISDFVDNLKSGVSEVTDALQEVFPFSIPWDLMAIFGLFSAESKAPVFDIPIVVPSLGINETFHIDFSDFEYISVICRTMLGISFAVGLMWITIELTKEGD